MVVEKQKTHNLLLFILLAYGQIWTLYGIGQLFDIAFSMNPQHLGGVLFVYGAAIPSISAIISTLITEKKEGLRLLFRRSFQWRFPSILYLSAFLTPILVNVLNTIIAISFLGAKFPEKWFSPIFGMGFLLFFLLHNGIGEEIGWRGLALNVLQKRLGSLGGNLCLGFLWAIWHLPLFFIKGSLQYGDSTIIYIYLLTCWSIIIGMLVNKSKGSILTAILFHETANFIAFAIRYPGTYYVFLIWGFAAGIAIVFLPRPLFKIPWLRYASHT